MSAHLNHLTERQISELLIGCAAAEHQSHLESCPSCAEKVAALQGPLRQFRGSVQAWSAERMSQNFEVPPQHRWYPPLARVGAFALLLLLTFVAVRFLTRTTVNSPAPAVASAASDAALLDAVRLDVSRPVPVRMAPLVVSYQAVSHEAGAR